MTKKLLKIVLPVCFLASCFQAVVLGQSWIQTTAPATGWVTVASSADGSRLVAAAGSIYLSTNSGATWALASAPYTIYSRVASSADGSRLVGITAPGGFSISTNYGATWSTTNLPLGNRTCLAVSADVSKIVIGGLDSALISHDSGATWSTRTNLVLIEVTSSADGIKMAGRGLYSTYTSTNSGADWLEGTNYLNYHSLASSADGTRLIATVTGTGPEHQCDNIYTSVDSGATWQETSAPYACWVSVASSADGTKLVAQSFGSGTSTPIYTSADGGVTWLPNTVPNGETWGVSWEAVASSADGCKLVAAVYQSGIYTFQTTPTPLLNVKTSDGKLKLSWTVPSMRFVLQQSGDASAQVWTDVPITPVLNSTKLQNEVILPTQVVSTFYRLVSR